MNKAAVFIFSSFVLFAIVIARDTPENCVDKFCPPGTFCLAREIVKCKNTPCKPMLFCIPNPVNGCATVDCATGLVCVERPTRCIGRSCKKTPKCVKSGTCDALVCPPSHKCEASPTPKCVKTILTESDVGDLDRAAEGPFPL
uniref:TIL domain-containing protein n=1 Tax=Panagrellus redivivus TaxID=6233 RepID=A0A7E4WBD3_PANRE